MEQKKENKLNTNVKIDLRKASSEGSTKVEKVEKINKLKQLMGAKLSLMGEFLFEQTLLLPREKIYVIFKHIEGTVVCNVVEWLEMKGRFLSLLMELVKIDLQTASLFSFFLLSYLNIILNLHFN